MTLPAPTYDLVLLLDPQAEEDVRAKIVADTRASISAEGELLRHDEWGERALTYPIDRKATARYHLLQFHAANPELLGGLDRTLRLIDEVLRFRIIKLAPGVGAPPEMSPAAPPRAETSAEQSESAPAAETPAADAPATPEPAAETPAAEPETEAAPQPPADVEPTAEVTVGETS
ncbi:MAG TPA: 30S ribosomal protein S6 [Solirubrobacteraceae bacterium]|nr:30S ribosomal protein S6 [Solirubrobacteraceae bacterium]